MKTKGIYLLYRILQAFGLPALVLYFLFRGFRRRGYWHSLPQRCGFLPRSFRQTGPGAIWLHAVSVGEILACLELVRRLRRDLPLAPLFVSTSTLAGHATAAPKLEGLATGVFYAPVDYVFAVRRVLRTLRPSVVVIAETEIWPNLFREVKRSGAGLTLVNGRISDRAFPRYQRARWLFRAVLPALDSIQAQTEAIRERFLELGALPERTSTAGNFKYDFEPTPAPVDSLPAGPVWIAASTMPPAESGDVDEDDAVLAAFRELAPSHPGLLLILAPRKPERFDVVARKLEAAGLPYVRRTAGNPPTPGSVLLLDTIGELAGLFARAGVVFMGGTLARRGGHNILEPAFFAKPVIVGPHMENFRDIAAQFSAAGASVQIRDPAGLATAVDRLLRDPASAHEIGNRAFACAQARRGATACAAEEVRRLHSSHLPHYRPAMPWFAILWPLSRLWLRGGRRRQARYLRIQRRIDAPVVSIGNITMGGTGKTPCVLRLAQILKDRGRHPGILTRGYRRSSPEKHTVLAAGANVKAEHSGDEPQIFVRSGLAPVGIGADRYRTGMQLRHDFGVNILLLDDGFQHLKLARDVDILLIDAIQPFGGGDAFPLGRLREPLENLVRADLFLITRSELASTAPAIQNVLPRWNPAAPVFLARTKPEAWVEHRSGQRYNLAEKPFGRAAAFCGLGNPQSFRRTLEALGLDLADWNEFEDHHRYQPRELTRIAGQAQVCGATALLTTGKDAVNLCEQADDLLAPLSLFWLDVSMEIEREDEFVAALERKLSW